MYVSFWHKDSGKGEVLSYVNYWLICSEDWSPCTGCSWSSHNKWRAGRYVRIWQPRHLYARGMVFLFTTPRKSVPEKFFPLFEIRKIVICLKLPIVWCKLQFFCLGDAMYLHKALCKINDFQIFFSFYILEGLFHPHCPICGEWNTKSYKFVFLADHNGNTASQTVAKRHRGSSQWYHQAGKLHPWAAWHVHGYGHACRESGKFYSITLPANSSPWTFIYFFFFLSCSNLIHTYILS